MSESLGDATPPPPPPSPSAIVNDDNNKFIRIRAQNLWVWAENVIGARKRGVACAPITSLVLTMETPNQKDFYKLHHTAPRMNISDGIDDLFFSFVFLIMFLNSGR